MTKWSRNRGASTATHTSALGSASPARTGTVRAVEAFGPRLHLDPHGPRLAEGGIEHHGDGERIVKQRPGLRIVTAPEADQLEAQPVDRAVHRADGAHLVVAHVAALGHVQGRPW